MKHCVICDRDLNPGDSMFFTGFGPMCSHCKSYYSHYVYFVPGKDGL